MQLEYISHRCIEWIFNCDPDSGFHVEAHEVVAHDQCTKEDISEEKNEVESSLQLNFDHFLGINVIETGNDFPEQISINATGADSVDQSEPIIHNFELEGFEQSDFPI